MARQEKGGFRPPPLGKILWKCPSCNTFNAADAGTCKKCGAAKVEDAAIAGATFKPIDDSERLNQDQKAVEKVLREEK
ncbi:MAG: hypothetical protein RSN88_07275 [Gordonibacter sp.]|uniref:hypothetical protein n=1 Tax=Gordonibacter sp. TaxID=1968902 RepID=UPI002FCC23C2